MKISEFKKDVKKITNYYKKLISYTKNGRSVGSMNEWIIDNYYVISEQEKNIKDEYRFLETKYIKGKRKKLLYSLVYNILKTNDFQIDITGVFEKLNKYQSETKDYFSFYEINFIYLFIKISLISELRVLCEKFDNRLVQKEQVEKSFNLINRSIKENNDIEIEDYIEISNDIIESPYYIEQIHYKLKKLGDYSEDSFVKLNELLQKRGTSFKELIEQSHNDMANDNFIIINIFNSLKKIVKYEIEYLYKNISFTEQLLVKEKAGIYDEMYDVNKMEYRVQITKNARALKMSEYDYTSSVITLADENNKHVGWYLFKRPNYKRRAFIYVFLITIFSIILALFVSGKAGLPFFLITLIPMSVIVIDTIAQIIRHFSKPNSLFKMKFEDGLTKEHATMVVIPTILSGKRKVLQMFEKLEVYYLSNKTDNLYFTLLGDCTSEDVKEVDFDNEVVEAGLSKVNELNEKYGKNIFNFVYRNRFYSESEGSYLGFERKRGALLHFNQLLLDKLSKEEKKAYFNCETITSFNKKIKYVITLDTDTRLVLNSALKLIGAMAHPMNRPILSKDKTHVVSGFGIMQPRIGIDIEVTSKSKYSQLFAGLGGLDVYITASFDLYQDVFGEGSFVGKGIYDLEVFDTVLSNAFPDNLILSHDLLEGNYLRCGFINDVELFDDYPSNYLNDALRHHRWNRGDWQISGWLKRRVKNKEEKRVKNPLNLLAKWKVFDNLRRSFVNPFLLLIIFYAFTIGSANAFYYVSLVLLVIIIPIIFYVISMILYRNKYDIFLKYYLNLIKGIIAVINKSFISFAILPYEAYLYIDSTIKALYRMFISRKNLLNWVTAEELEKVVQNNLKTYLRSFRPNYIASILLIACSLVFKPHDMWFASIISLIWITAPLLMCFYSRRLEEDTKELNEKEKEDILDMAAKTWKYFDDLLTEDKNYLIPDNYQLNREEKLDHKTSPTNIGYSLLSVISAYELGFITLNKALRMLNNIMKTIAKLEKWHGLLYNWYNIYTLKKMTPHFVSTVDTGNLIANFYVVKGFALKHNNQDLLYHATMLIENMDFTKLYNKDLDVFSIGYNDSEQALLPYNYNNFASEARLTSFIAIAKGDAPYKHWFCLNKSLTKYKQFKGVVSWNGTAFEYFMPLIYMKTYKHTLLDESYYYAYFTQREFIKEVDPNLPWGISESSYNELDDSQNYKYTSFGVPYLKSQDNLSYPIVVSPYSSAMAISIDDEEVYNNLVKFKKLNMYGEYGFYDAYDYEEKAVVKNYYAHHQGMILASLTNYLKDNIIQDYFHSDKKIASVETLLKEKVQIRTYIDLKIAKYKKYQYIKEDKASDQREINGLNDIPEMEILSNGLYTIILDDRGVGFSKYKNLQINRYRKVGNEEYGIFFYIRNLKTNNLWSNTYAPLNVKPENYKVVFASDRIKYIREDDGIMTSTEITVPKDHNAEIRRLVFKNNNDFEVTLEITSYGEVIIARNEEDVAHRAFNSITINSEADLSTNSLLFSRKSRTKENTRYYIINRMFSSKGDNDSFEFETSRDKFLGRNNNVTNPDVIINNKELTKSLDDSLDSIMSIRKQVTIPAKGKNTLYYVVGFGKSREQVMEVVEAYKDEFTISKAFDIATVSNNIKSSYANLTPHQVHLYNTILKFIYGIWSPSNEQKTKISENKLSQETLWKFGVSGDRPIILAEIDNLESLGFIKEVLQIFEYYKDRSIYVDVAIINNSSKLDKTGTNITNKYVTNLMYHINNINGFENEPGNVYVIDGKEVSEEEKKLLEMVSVISFNASSEMSLSDQVRAATDSVKYVDEMKTVLLETEKIEAPKDIVFNNEFGGFVSDGSEYLINNPDTPAPWINVVANEKFGTIISNTMSGFTFAHNSREFKLTSWSNDPTTDPASEKILINKKVFRPSLVRHGFGYSVFESSTEYFDIMLKVFVHDTDTAKFYQLSIKNKSKDIQKLEVDFLAKIVLGVSEEYSNRFITSNLNKEDNCLYLKNNYNNNFKNVKAYMSSTEPIISSFDNIKSKGINIEVDIDKLETKTFSFVLGCMDDNESYTKYDEKEISTSFERVKEYWREKLSVINVKTPDKSLNYVLNGWYLYQTYASRLFAKSGFYQVGGATGFRDQLQDVMSIIYSNPDKVRSQILEHAKHQFKEGDVLHWWHEELMLGSRTKFTDDYLWLVYVTSEYLKITEDNSILNEKACFVTGEQLHPNESEKGIHYEYTDDEETLYNHLKLCITKALNQFGRHNIPLMGSGDWNDGMNKVGHQGKGESVFVGFFLYDLLPKMASIATIYQDSSFAHLCDKQHEKLKGDLGKNTWDGSWYLRGYFDNGETLGSRNNEECKIDLLCQAWSVLSNFAPSEKKEIIHNEVEKNLVDKENKIIKLLTPAFENSRNNPGYIMDYKPGVRENGGQYTHAALWYVSALIKENKLDKAYKYYQMINPINRTLNKGDVEKYRVEPYVIAADIYSHPNYPGRGGWSWYTGSASWAYKIGIEQILGFTKRGNNLIINPKIINDWKEYEITYKYLDTKYLIKVSNEASSSKFNLQVKLDNKIIKDNVIKLVNDKQEHIVNVVMKEDV